MTCSPFQAIEEFGDNMKDTISTLEPTTESTLAPTTESTTEPKIKTLSSNEHDKTKSHELANSENSGPFGYIDRLVKDVIRASH